VKQSELEELSFMFAYPEEHAEIKNRVESLRKEQEDVVLEVSDGYSLLRKLFLEAGRS
jgi:(p)ppGpp synthase/HD superfamily hydrolase